MRIRSLSYCLKHTCGIALDSIQGKNLGGHIVTSRSVKFSLILLVISVGLNVYFRLAPAYFPQFKKEARVILEQRIAAASSTVLTKKYPGYGAGVRRALITDVIRKESRSKEFRARLLQEYAALCGPYQDKTHQTYLLELDPYQWMRDTENVLGRGFPGTKREGNKIYDTYMLAPRAREIGHINFLFYCSAALYRVFSFFSPATTLEHFLFYLPLFYVSIFLIILYYFSKQYFSSFGAFCTTLYVGCNGIFIKRSCAGWYDYDVLSMIMPLIVLWCLAACLRSTRVSGRYGLWLVCASFFQGLYTFTWIGWWFLLLVIIAAFFLIALNNYALCERHRAHKEALFFIGTLFSFLIGSALFCFLISRVNMGAEFIALLRENITLGKSASASIWPDVRYTISELQALNVKGGIKNLYGGFIGSIVIVACAWIYFRERRGRNVLMVYSMLIWAFFMAYVSLKGARFIVYLIIPLGFFFGWAVTEILKLLRERVRSSFRMGIIGFAGVVGILTFMLATFLHTGAVSSRNDYPLMNDEWYETLQYVKAHTPPGAILNSWWDYGNFFKAVADRLVIFDGQSQCSGSLGYWMSRILLTHDEYYAMRILTMLNNASDTTFSLLAAYCKEPYEAQRILEKLLAYDRARGDVLLQKHNVPQEIRQQILNDLHTVPRTAYFVVDTSMIGKMSNISFIGNWSFPKAFVARNSALAEQELLKRLERIFGLSAAEAETYYNEVVVSGAYADSNEILSRRFSFYTNPVPGALRGKLLHFANGVVYNLETNDTLLYVSSEQRYVTPKKVVIYRDGEKETYTNPSGDFSKCICIIKNADRYTALILNEDLLDSLFMRLMLLEGKGLTYFKHFYTSAQGTVRVYTIQWPQ